MNLRRLGRVNLALGLFASLAWGQTRISLDERLWVASKIYASIPIYFAHWQGVRDFDLDAVYKEYLKGAAAAETRWDFDFLTLEFMARLKNGHTTFDDIFLNRAGGPPIGFYAVPVEGKWTVLETHIDKLGIGDVIERIDRVSMDRFFADKRKYISASSDAAAEHVFFYRVSLFPQQFRLHLASGSDVAIDRSTQKLRAPEPSTAETRWIEEPSIAYIRIHSFADPKYEDAALSAVKQYRNARTIVFDVRGNAGGSEPGRLLRAIIDRPYRDWSQASAVSVGLFRAFSRLRDIAAPGEITERESGYFDALSEFAEPQLMAPGRLIQPADPIFRGRILILADFACASACEDFVMPLKYSRRATVIGERTFGSAGQPFLYDFGNGMSIRISSRRMYFPDGAEFEGVGIAPDVEVKPSLADRQAGKDTALERAIRLASERSGVGIE
jgi:carboxyl-terminal processing protease